jgi:hypothetical protein
MAGTAQSQKPKAAAAVKARPAVVRAPAPPARRVAPPPRTASPAVRLSAPPRAAKLPGLPGTSGGAPLPSEVRDPIEGSFGVNLEAVRVHSDADARGTTASLSARAFTFGNHIFLGPGERATDKGLLAHEAAHVVQQQGGAAVQRWAGGHSDASEREAHRASAAVVGGAPFTVRERTSNAKVQRLGISDALDFFADAANAIPGYRMFTIVLGVNPINMSPVARDAANVMRAVVEFIPGGNLITRALDTYGVFDRVGNWVEQQLRTLGMVGSSFRQAIMDFLDSLSWRDIFRLGSVWDRAKRIFTEPVSQLISFARGLITGILGFLREAVLRPLARLAEGTQAYNLLKAVLGQDPITGDPVPQNADTLIGGFMKLIGQEEVWNNLKRANAVARAWSWFQGALSGVLGYVRQVPGLIISTLQSIVLEDFLPITNLFAKVGRAFGGFLGSFFSWAGGQVMSLLEIIFDVVAPGVMPYVRKAMGAFRMIIQNPIGFVGNLVRAGIQGFRQFAGNFLNHLRASLIGWLTGTMSGAGIYIPQAFNLREIIKFVLSVLGLTWQNLRQKLVRAVGETAVAALETGFDIVVTLVTQGPAAAWEKIQEAISNLRDMVMGQIMTFVRNRVVEAAITKLVTSLNPAGAFIQAIIATYNTIMFFVERLRQIAQVVASFIDSISAIAAGNIGSAANRVETTMAGLLTLVISFLARFAGLGRVSDAVKDIVNRLRAPFDRAMERVVEWIVTTGRRLGRLVVQGASRGAAAIVGALRSLVGGRVTLSRVAPAVQAEAQRTQAGATLYENRRGSGPAALQGIVQSTPGVRFDNASGALTLPPVNAGTLAAAPSLRAMAQSLGQTTGVTRVTLSKSSTGWALDAHVNPTLAGLASHTPGSAALEPLLAEIARETGRISPNTEMLMAICREAARRNGATVAITNDPRNRRWNVTFTIAGSPPFTTYIVTTSDDTCPSCAAAPPAPGPGVQNPTRPHSVIPGSMWGAAIDFGFGQLAVVPPYDLWGQNVRAAGTSTTGPAVTEDRQCANCERAQDRPPAPHSLVQRRAGVAAGYVINPRPPAPAGLTTQQAFVGSQYGVPGGATAMTDAQVRELTRMKIDQVIEELGSRLNLRPTGAGGARPVTSPVYINIVSPGAIARFQGHVRRSITARVGAARAAGSYL